MITADKGGGGCLDMEAEHNQAAAELREKVRFLLASL